MTDIKSTQASAALSIAPTPARLASRPALLRFGLIFLAVCALIAASLAMSGVDPLALFARVSFHPHAPDLELLAAQPLAIRIHLLAALAALALGAVMMLSRKGRTFHRMAGWTWVSIMALVAGSSLFITGLNGNRWSLIHLLSGWTLIVLPLAVIAARRHEVMRHRRSMMGLFYGGLIFAGLLAFLPGRLLWHMLLG